jgi:hypothetical protein
MMTGERKRKWFTFRRYGWSWRVWPVTWQGWVVTTIWLVAAFATVLSIATGGSDPLFPFLIMTVVMMAVVFFKGELPPEWPWGK